MAGRVGRDVPECFKEHLRASAGVIRRALLLYWTAPESNAIVVQINGLEKDELVLC
jgi:hypothetical protein